MSYNTQDKKPLGRCMVKPLGQLVQVSLTPYNASTSCLSTSSSITTLPDLVSGLYLATKRAVNTRFRYGSAIRLTLLLNISR
ncbi:hypothetical protein ALTERO38_52224 [Alteromonas sp. 38]|nr:hypothetical protein ALTERO38_52224 [Alteromonas sp. 38]